MINMNGKKSRIMICGSMAFAEEMVKAKNKLEKMGCVVRIPTDTKDIIEENHDHDDLEADYEHCIENEIMKKHFEFIENSDGILVLNYKKNNIEGYIGTATLMEIGLAHHLDKKIFLLNSLPDPENHRWAHEVRITQPKILGGNLENIQECL